MSLIAAIAGALLAWYLFFGPLQKINIDTLNNFQANGQSSGGSSNCGYRRSFFFILRNAMAMASRGSWSAYRQVDGRGARQVVFDVVFAEPSNEESDNLFAQSISAANRVVLASDLTERDDGFISGTVEVRPIELFEDYGALVGLAGVDVDSDLVVRFHPPYTNTLSSVAAGLNDIDIEEKTRIVKYVGPDHSFPYVSYVQLFVEDGTPPGFFQDKTVLVGLDVKASPDAQASQIDSFPTPFTRFNARLTPGVEVHANLLDNLLRENWVRNATEAENFLLLIFMTAIAFFSCSSWKPIRSLVIGLGLNLVSFSLSFYLWSEGYFLNILIGVPPFILAYIAGGGQAYLTEGNKKE